MKQLTILAFIIILSTGCSSTIENSSPGLQNEVLQAKVCWKHKKGNKKYCGDWMSVDLANATIFRSTVEQGFEYQYWMEYHRKNTD